MMPKDDRDSDGLIAAALAELDQHQCDQGLLRVERNQEQQ